ncbi:hypothetical protein D210916BOD24_33200 [Alteromonas sp. D210916BOD_24]|uniref:hypothetical protein n=1 Tax=Alteromonas sp. D210916BOD_24 TaxID=3157618 RepID=UPI00399C8D0A
MARISQRAMNNVVIIAMLVMIALFNLDSLLPKPDVSSLRTLLPQEAYVLKIEQDNNSLSRSGQQWRQSTQHTTPSVNPQRQFSEWQRAQLEPTSSVPAEISSSQPYVVVVWVAGSATGLVYALYPNTTPTVVKFENNWYTLTNAELDVLLPWNL